MPKPNEKLAESLAALQALQEGGRRVFRSSELSRTHRERLLRNGFLREVMKGWLMSSSPSARAGDSTPWYASFWEFCASYCEDRFDSAWHLSPEQSLLLHAQNTVIPKQVVVYSPKGTNHTMDLLFGTSLYDLKQREMPPAADVSVKDGLRLFSPPAALVKAPEAFFTRNPIETQVVLAGIRDASDVLRLSPERRPLRKSRAARRSVPPHRPARDRRRDRQDDEGGGIRRARKRSVRSAAIIRRSARRHGAHCRAHAGDVGIDAGRGYRELPESARTSEEQERVSALRRRNI